MANSINVGDLIRVKVVFRRWSNESEEYGPPESVDDDSVLIDIRLNGELITFAEPLYASRFPYDDGEPVQYYYYDWEPTETGQFQLEFTGSFDGSPTQVVEVFTVGSDSPFGLSLMEDQEIIFLGEISPLYVDPETILLHYPDSNAAEVAEYIHRYSVEVDRLLGYPSELPFVAYEYIQAAVLCSLGKVYDFAMGGGEASSISLGDLRISNQSYPKNTINRANASNWCELAAALRDELIRGSANLKTVVAGKNRPNPMPKRGLRKASRGTSIGTFKRGSEF